MGTPEVRNAPESVCYFENIKCIRISYGENFNAILYRFLNLKQNPPVFQSVAFIFHVLHQSRVGFFDITSREIISELLLSRN